MCGCGWKAHPNSKVLSLDMLSDWFEYKYKKKINLIILHKSINFEYQIIKITMLIGPYPKKQLCLFSPPKKSNIITLFATPPTSLMEKPLNNFLFIPNQSKGQNNGDRAN